MRCTLTIQCDNCLNDLELEFQKQSLKDNLNLNVIRKKINNEGWHDGKLCLCPDCKEEIGENNCMNCNNMHYNDFNYRCEKDASIVSKYDTCSQFM